MEVHSEPIVLIESKFCQRASERLCPGSLAHLTASSGVEDMVNINLQYGL
jgi:hypothetical protein